MNETQEALARYINLISENETEFDMCSKKIQDIYRKKAGWILDFLNKQKIIEYEESIK